MALIAKPFHCRTQTRAICTHANKTSGNTFPDYSFLLYFFCLHWWRQSFCQGVWKLRSSTFCAVFVAHFVVNYFQYIKSLIGILSHLEVLTSMTYNRNPSPHPLPSGSSPRSHNAPSSAAAQQPRCSWPSSTVLCTPDRSWWRHNCRRFHQQCRMSLLQGGLDAQTVRDGKWGD